MKKTLLAAALMAGFAGIAQAETSVTLYGIIDGGIGYDRVKSHNADGSTKSTRTGLIDGVQSGNRWGLKGTEDLGNGLRANFVLESGFNLANGRHAQDERLFGRRHQACHIAVNFSCRLCHCAHRMLNFFNKFVDVN